MATLRLAGLTKRYGTVDAVRDVTLEVADGELLVLLGASGSGKSTILKLIAGIEVPDSGEIWIDEQRVDGLLPGLRDVAMVFQSYALYPHMSVEANLAFPLRSVRLPKEEIGRRVAEVARLLELDGLLARRPAQLSGGQQQRVALGRAIVRHPKAYLMDEPLSNLDAKLRARTRQELSRLHEQLATTTVYVTHDQVEAMTMGQRIAVLEHGELHQVAAPERVYEYPADLVVAEFVGSPPMNCTPVRLCVERTEVLLSAPGVQLRVPILALDPEVQLALPSRPAEVVLGVRPEYLWLASPGAVGPGGCSGFRASVERVELLGAERLVHLRAGDWCLCARVAVTQRPQRGEAVSVGLRPEGLRLFDALSGRRLEGVLAVTRRPGAVIPTTSP